MTTDTARRATARIVADGPQLATAVAMMREYVAWMTAMAGVRLIVATGAAPGELRDPASFYGGADGCLALAFDDDHVIGVAGMRIVDDDLAVIRRCYVRPENRRQGGASSLVAALLAEAQRRGISRIRAEVTAASAPAITGLIDTLGFTPIGPRRANAVLPAGVVELDLITEEVKPMYYVSPELVAAVDADRRQRWAVRRKRSKRSI